MSKVKKPPADLARSADAQNLKSDEERLGVSATTYLTLCAWLGIHAAFAFVVVTAIAWIWLALCRRYPMIAIFTISLIRGLFRR